MKRDRLPNPVDVGFWDAVGPQHLGSQVGALDLEASLALGMLAEPQVVHDGGDPEQLLVISRIVISRIVQGALMFGKQAREDKASDAVVSDRPTLRRADEREARLSERPVGSTRMSFIAPYVASSRNAFTSVANWLWC